MAHKKKEHMKHEKLGIPKEMHEAHKNDAGYQKRVKELAKHHKSGSKGMHPMEKSHKKHMTLAKKVKKMG